MSGIAGMPEFAGQGQFPPEPGERDRVVRSIVLGVAGALVGAAVWVAVGAATKHEIGFVAVGVGFVVAMAMGRVRAGWSGLPIVAGVIALVAVVAGDFVLDVILQAQAEGFPVGDAFSSVATDPSLAREIFSAYFSPIDLLFWLIAASVAYRGVKASVLAAVSRPPAPPAPPLSPSATPYGPLA